MIWHLSRTPSLPSATVSLLTFYLFLLFLSSVSAVWNDLAFYQFARRSGPCAFVKAALLHGILSAHLYSHLIVIYSFLRLQPLSHPFPQTPQAVLGIPHHAVHIPPPQHFTHTIIISCLSQYHKHLFISKFSETKTEWVYSECYLGI